MKNKENFKENYIKLIGSITNSNKNIILKIRECIDEPIRYYLDNHLKYIERGFDDYTNDKEICFWAMIDLLVENKYCCELDYKGELDEFIDSLQNLKNVINFTKENLRFEDDIYAWCDTINNEWKTKKKCIVNIDTNNDSYILFISDVENLNYISSLAKSLGFNIIKISYTKDELRVYDDIRNKYFINYYDEKILSINSRKTVSFLGGKTYAQLWEIFILISFVVIFIVSFGVGMINGFCAPILFVCLFGLLFLLRNIYEKIQIYLFYKIRNGDKKINLINNKNSLIIEKLYESDAIIFSEELNVQLFNFVYNLLNNNNLLKVENVDAYIVNGKYLHDKLNIVLYNNSQKLLLISLNDLNLTSVNKNVIYELHRYMKANLLKESIKQSIEINEAIELDEA